MSATPLELRHLRKGDRVRIVDAKRREDLEHDGRIGRVVRVNGVLAVRIATADNPAAFLPLEGPDAAIVELVEVIGDA